MTEAAFKDCEWYFCARYAAIGHRGQNIENGSGHGAPGSGPALERLAEVVDAGHVRRVRAIERTLFRLPAEVASDLELAFDPFEPEHVWGPLRAAFRYERTAALRICERSRLAISECRAAYKLAPDAPRLEPSMVREWMASVLKRHYAGNTGELPRAHVLSHIVEAARQRVAVCLAAYDEEKRRAAAEQDDALPGERP